MNDHDPNKAISEMRTQFIEGMQRKTEAQSAVEHPPHYRPDGIEAITVIEAWNLDFCLGNALKYICRAGIKSEDTYVQDLEKAVFYLNRAIQFHNSKER
jgi:hypothetical protein